MRWTKYQAEQLIRYNYHKMRRQEATENGGFLLLLLPIAILIYIWRRWWPIILIAGAVTITVLIVERVKKKKRTISPADAYLNYINNGSTYTYTDNYNYNYPPQTQSLPPAMTGHDFEHYCAGLLRQNGYTNVQVTKASGDNGVDILAERDGIRYAIQTKLYTGTVGNDAVQQVNAGRAIYECHAGIVLTNSTFTQSAKENASRLGIVLWDGSNLNAMEIRARAAQQPPQWVEPPQQAHCQPPYQPPYWAAPQAPQGLNRYHYNNRRFTQICRPPPTHTQTSRHQNNAFYF